MLSNWTKSTTTTTGSGSLTITPAGGYVGMSQSLSVGEYVPYSLETSDGKFESGVGRLTASTTFERSRINSTWNGVTYNQVTATALSLPSGTHTLTLTPMAETLAEPLRYPMTSQPNQAFFSNHLGTTQANVAITSASSREVAYPFILGTSGILTGFGIYVSVAQAGSAVVLALYNVGGNGNPDAQLAAASASIDTSATGWKEISLSANIRVKPGVYYIGVNVISGSVPSVTGSATYLHTPFGSSNRAGLQSVRCDSVSTVLSNPFPVSSLTYVGTGSVPFIGLLLS